MIEKKSESIKRKVFQKTLSNTRLTAFIYNHYKSKEEKEIQQLSYEMGEVDTIKDIAPLLELKRQIVQEKRKFYSHNGNASGYRLYGIGKALFGEHDGDIHMLPSIEHGLIFHNQNWTDTSLTARASCVTFGSFRKEILRRYYQTPVFEVGPYIQYAQDYYSKEQMVQWKQQLGKTLLVFPMHSTDEDSLKYNINMYVNEIACRAKKFDSVLVCVFWWNLDDEIVNVFRALGYQIVSAGYREDQKFLSRQKTLIEVSDYVISDAIGTHIGYCYKLGKKVEIIKVKTEKSSLREEFDVRQMKTIADALSMDDLKKTEQVMNYYWGNNISLTREELDAIEQINREITITGKYKIDNYIDAIKHLMRVYKEEEGLKYELLCKATGRKN